MSIKTFFNIDAYEAIVVDKIREKSKKYGNFEVFVPTTPRLKDIDLVLMDMKNNKTKTIQVKGSATYIPKEKEVNEFGEGSGGWIQITRKTIFEPINEADFFILVIHSLQNIFKKSLKQKIKTNFLIIPASDMKKIVKRKKIRKPKNPLYAFFIWVNPKKKKSWEFNEWDNKQDFSKYLENWDLLFN
jgi:hypothetical protein